MWLTTEIKTACCGGVVYAFCISSHESSINHASNKQAWNRQLCVSLLDVQRGAPSCNLLCLSCDVRASLQSCLFVFLMFLFISRNFGSDTVLLP